MGDLSEELQQRLTRERGESDLILEGGNGEHILIGDIALDEVGTDAAHVVDTQHRLFVIVLGSPDEDIAQEIGKIALRPIRVHVVRHASHDGCHDTVVHFLIGGKELSRCLVRVLVVTTVNDDSRALHTGQLVVLWGTRCQHQCGKNAINKLSFKHNYKF